MAAPFPLSEDFESRFPGALLEGFRNRITSNLEMTQDHTPRSGARHLTMDSSTIDGQFPERIDTDDRPARPIRCEAPVLGQRLSTTRIIGLPPTRLSAVRTFDGVAISEDGINWYEVQGLRGEVSADYTQFEVDLDQAIAIRGLSYNPLIPNPLQPL